MDVAAGRGTRIDHIGQANIGGHVARTGPVIVEILYRRGSARDNTFVRRPRIGGFLAGCFYATTAGAVSVS